MRWKACVVVVLVAAVTTGCGGVRSSGGTLATATSPVLVEPSCPPQTSDPQQDPGGGERSIVAADFVTSWVLLCRSDSRDLPGKGSWMVQIAERADTPATELVDQLRRPSDARTAEACTADLVVPPYFLLVDAAGRAILPAIPTDSCGKPRSDAFKALQALPFRTLSETPIKQIQSQQSIDAGCEESWKDVIAIGADHAKPGPASPVWPTPPNAIRVCVYQADRGSELVGQFVSGRTVSGDAAKALAAALDNADPATSCFAPHTRFAVLTAEGKGSWATVELDGCHRLLRENNTLGQLDGSTVAALIG